MNVMGKSGERLFIPDKFIDKGFYPSQDK